MSTVSGMALALLSFALLTSVDTIFKLMVADHPIYQILFTNGCFALIPIFIWAALTGGVRQRLRTGRFAQHLLRGSISLTSAFLAVFAYSQLPLTDFYAIVFAGPLLVTIISVVWLGEKIEWQRWFAILLGFSGIMIVTSPFHNPAEHTPLVEGTSLLIGRCAAFGSVLCYAFSVVIIRHMRAGETNITFSLYGYVASLTGSGFLTLLHTKDIAPLSYQDILHLALSGVLAGISSICLMTAYHRTPASLVAPFQYTQIIWGAIAGYVLWGQIPGPTLIVGAVIVALSGLYVIYSEMRFKPVHS